jgi:hypothetical protein
MSVSQKATSYILILLSGFMVRERNCLRGGSRRMMVWPSVVYRCEDDHARLRWQIFVPGLWAPVAAAGPRGTTRVNSQRLY